MINVHDIINGVLNRNPFSSKLRYRGDLVIRKNGEVVEEIHNLVMTVGKNLGVSRLFSNTEFAVLSAIGIGSSATAAAVTQTALVASLAQVAFDSAAVRSGTSVSATTTFGPGIGTGSIQEAGLFNATSGGTMFSRSTFTAIPKAATDTVSVTWTVTAP